MNLYTRYWFEFEIPEPRLSFLLPILIGVGVTAIDFQDAINIIDRKIFTEVKRPPFKKIIENVDIRDLDQGHVIPNMTALVYRGIWYPMGYEER